MQGQSVDGSDDNALTPNPSRPTMGPLGWAASPRPCARERGAILPLSHGRERGLVGEGILRFGLGGGEF
jgi:hypothetical protein